MSEVNKEIKKLDEGTNPPLNTEVNPDVLLADQIEDDTASSKASNLLAQAELIEGDAKAMMDDASAKRASAYELDPSLAPKKGPGRPPKAS